MSDKLKQKIAVLPEFSAGEQPQADKLTNIGLQTKNALRGMENAIGDLLGSSWPYSALTSTTLSGKWAYNGLGVPVGGSPERFLDIVNLGRIIGPSSILNPRTLSSPKVITEAIPAGLHEFSLRFVPDLSEDVTFSDTSVFNQFIGNPAGLTTAGEYSIDSQGRVYSYSATNGGTVTYTYDPSSVFGGDSPLGSTFNVIPDPNQLEISGSGLIFSAPDANNIFTVTLPDCTHQQSNIFKNSALLSGADPNHLVRLELPKVLVDNFEIGEEIPSNFIYLKNYTLNKVYESGIYYYNGRDSIKIENLDLIDDINAGHVFCLLTVGNSITTSIDDLRQKSFHSHDRRYGEPLIDVDNITGFIKHSGINGIFTKSEIEGNFAPQYLHRDGYTPGMDNGPNANNSMRGSLLIGRDPAFTAAPNTSHSIYLTDTNCSIKRVDNSIEINSIENFLVESEGFSSVSSGGEIYVYSENGDIFLQSENQEIKSQSKHRFSEGIVHDDFSVPLKEAYQSGDIGITYDGSPTDLLINIPDPGNRVIVSFDVMLGIGGKWMPPNSVLRWEGIMSDRFDASQDIDHPYFAAYRQAFFSNEHYIIFWAPRFVGGWITGWEQNLKPYRLVYKYYDII